MHRVVSGAAWTTSGAVVRSLLRLLTLAILARLLAPTDFGLAAALAVVIQFAQTLGLIGLAPALIQKKTVTEADIITAQTLALGLTLLLAVLNAVFAPQIAALFRLPDLVPLLRVASVLFVVQGLAAVARARMDRDLAFRRAALIELASVILGYSAVSIVLALAGFGVWSLVLGQLVQNSLAMVALLWSYPPIRRLWIDAAAARGLFRFGGYFSLGLLFDRLACQVDYIIVSRVLGAEALGLYSRAYQLMAGQARTASQGVSRVLFPALAKLQHAPERLARAYRRSLALSLVPMSLASAFIWLLADDIVALLLGAGWAAVADPFRWLGLAMIPRGAARINSAVLKAAGRVGTFAVLAAVYLLAVTSAAWFAAPFGIEAVARAVSLVLWGQFLLVAWVTVRGQDMGFHLVLQGMQPAAVLTVAAYIGGAVALMLTGSDLALARLTIGGAGGALALMLAGFLLPKAVLGPDAEWLRETLRTRRADS